MSQAYRPPSVVEADLDALYADAEAAGKKPHGPAVGRLRLELIESLKAELAAVTSDAPSTVTCPDSSLDLCDVDDEGFDQALAANPFDTDEWRFIEKAAAEVELQAGGNQTGIMKKLYHNVSAKLKVWRMAREIVLDIGIGAEWPQWTALNRNDATGKVMPKVEKPAPVEEPVEAPAAPEPVTDGGMPVRSSGPSKDDIMATVMGGGPRGVLDEVSQRPEPASRREAEAVTSA